MKTIKDPHGRYVDHFSLYPMLGFGHGQHLPLEGFEPRELQGVLIMCLPARGGKHRIMQQCDGCSKWVPFGRALQHKCKPA